MTETTDTVVSPATDPVTGTLPGVATPHPTATSVKHFGATDSEVGLVVLLIILALALGIYLVSKRRDEP